MTDKPMHPNAEHLANLERINNASEDEIRQMAAASHQRYEKAHPSARERIGNARSNMPEEVGSLLAEIYQHALATAKDKPEGWGILPPQVFRRLESMCKQNSTQMVPFPMIAEMMYNPKGDIEPKLVLRAAFSSLAHVSEKLYPMTMAMTVGNAEPDAREVLQRMAEATVAIQMVCNLFGWNIDDLRLKSRGIYDQQRKSRKNDENSV